MKIIALTFFLTAACCLLSAQSAAKKDEQFLREAAEGGMMEVKLGQLAMSKGSSQEVKTLGRLMMEEHTKTNNDLMVMAARKGISLPDQMSDKGHKVYAELSQKTGTAFDKAYAKFMEKNHKRDFKKFREAARKSEDPEIRDWAAQILPSLRQHREMSRDLGEKIRKNK